MTDKEKKVVFTLIAIMVIILIVVIIVKQVGGGNDNTNTANMNGTSTTNTTNTANEEKYTTELNDGTKLNNSEELQNVKTYKDLEISDIQVTSKNNVTVIIAQVKNNGTTDFEPEIVKLTLLGENNEEIDVTYPVMPSVEAGGTAQLESTISGSDVANFKDFRIEANDR